MTTGDRTDDYGIRGRRSGALGLGVRVPFGVEWKVADPPIGVFVEVVPVIAIVPQTTGIFQAGLGIRYYF